MTGTSIRTTEKQWLDQGNEGDQIATSGSAISWEPDSSLNEILTLTGNFTLASPANMTAGKVYTLPVKQDDTGGRLLSYGTAFRWHQDVEPVLSSGAGSLDVLQFYCDGTYLYGWLAFKSQEE